MLPSILASFLQSAFAAAHQLLQQPNSRIYSKAEDAATLSVNYELNHVMT